MKIRCSDIKSAINKANDLTSLNLTFPKYDLRIFKSEFLQFVNLTELSIQFDIQYTYGLPEEIGELISLRKLHILNYPFKIFPDWIFNLQNLENLMLRGNDIIKIPERIVELQNLKHFRIENTEIDDIPDCLSSLVKLKTLSLVDNFALNRIGKEILPKNLKWIALEPSGIPKSIIDKLNNETENLEFGKRYYD